MAGSEDVKTEDLVRVLDYDALVHFSSSELADRMSPDDPRLGIFVRLGRVIILGSNLAHGPKVVNRSMRLNHEFLITRGLNDTSEEVLESIRQSAPLDSNNYLKNRWPIVDAGRSRIETFGDYPRGLILFGKSGIFGKGESYERQVTGYLAQQVLGQSIMVETLGTDL